MMIMDVYSNKFHFEYSVIFIFPESDLAIMEFLLTFNDSTTYQVFNLEAVDDNLSEKEEWFVLYLNASHSQCAISVAIQDNDSEYMFAASRH